MTTLQILLTEYKIIAVLFLLYVHHNKKMEKHLAL